MACKKPAVHVSTYVNMHTTPHYIPLGKLVLNGKICTTTAKSPAKKKLLNTHFDEYFLHDELDRAWVGGYIYHLKDTISFKHCTILQYIHRIQIRQKHWMTGGLKSKGKCV